MARLPAHLAAKLGVLARETYASGRAEAAREVARAVRAELARPRPAGHTRLRRVRDALGMSQAEVAGAAGLDPYSQQPQVSLAERAVGPHRRLAVYGVVRRALMRLARARRRWRDHPAERVVWAAALALFRAGDGRCGWWLLDARPEHVRAVLLGVQAHTILRHRAATPAVEALNYLETELGPFEGDDKAWLSATLRQFGGGRWVDASWDWQPDPAWLVPRF